MRKCRRMCRPFVSSAKHLMPSLGNTTAMYDDLRGVANWVTGVLHRPKLMFKDVGIRVVMTKLANFGLSNAAEVRCMGLLEKNGRIVPSARPQYSFTCRNVPEWHNHGYNWFRFSPITPSKKKTRKRPKRRRRKRRGGEGERRGRRW